MKFLFRHIHRFLVNFFRCGVTGWCMEILYTSFQSFRKKNPKLTGTTSLWMFPIYGMAAALEPIFYLCRKKSCHTRGICYALIIFGAEYLSGYLLNKKKSCPWNYSNCKWNIHSLIRLDFFPLWFTTGLIMEHMVTKTPLPEKHRLPSAARKQDHP